MGAVQLATVILQVVEQIFSALRDTGVLDPAVTHQDVVHELHTAAQATCLQGCGNAKEN